MSGINKRSTGTPGHGQSNYTAPRISWSEQEKIDGKNETIVKSVPDVDEDARIRARSKEGHDYMTRKSEREIRKRKLDHDIPHRDRAARAANSLLGRKKR